MPFRFKPGMRLDPSQVEDLRGRDDTAAINALKDFERILKSMQTSVWQARHPKARIRRYEDGSFEVIGSQKAAQDIYDKLQAAIRKRSPRNR